MAGRLRFFIKLYRREKINQFLCGVAIIVSLFLAIFGSVRVLSSSGRTLLSNRNPHTVED